jgi:hypothetical protein
MKKKTAIPKGNAKFTEFFVHAYKKVIDTASTYGFAPDKIAVITLSYNAFIEAETVASNPETATSAARQHRDHCHKTLESDWRNFLNENVRFNTLISDVDLAVFGIVDGDDTPTTAGVPTATGTVLATRVGVSSYEIRVLDSNTGKPKNPEHSTGSYLYVAVTEVGQQPAGTDDYRKKDFSSNNKHLLEFTNEQVGKQAHIFARYSNAHGKEGPRGEDSIVVIY